MATILQPGEMDQVVSLQKLSTVTDAYGQREVWEPWTMVAAKCEPLAGREFFAAGTAQNPSSLRVSIYWLPHMPADLRVVWMGVTYQLTAAPIDVGGRHYSLDLMCKEIPP